ncbi:MAG: hypothetical protein ACE5FY_01010 [Nitrospiria bacterium]
MQADLRQYLSLAIIWLITVSLASHTMAIEDDGEFPPDMAFLEFLGTWETEDGEWIDPLIFEGNQTGNIRVNAEESDSGILKKDKKDENKKIKQNVQTEEKENE